MLVDGTGPFVFFFGTNELNPIFDGSSGSRTFTAHSFPWAIKDEPRVWSTTAKLKMKVGVVSVPVPQHAEGRCKTINRC